MIHFGVNMVSNEQIKQCINECMKAGHFIGLRDISYVLLCKQFNDKEVAYKALFGGDVDYTPAYLETYDHTASIEYLRIYAAQNFVDNASKKRKKDYDDITFDENKAYMLKLKKDTEEAMTAGEIDKKDGLKILADLSVKLNDKFNVNDSSHEQLIYVNCKFNSICERCGTELYIPTKQDLMEKYNLIEKE